MGKRKPRIDSAVQDAVVGVLGSAPLDAEPDLDLSAVGLIDVFGREAPKGKPRQHYLDDIPEPYRLDDYEDLKPYDRKGIAPSYYDGAERRGVHFFDVLAEKGPDMSLGETKKFIRQHFNPRRPYEMMMGVDWAVDNDRHLKDDLKKEVLRLDRKYHPYYRRKRRIKAVALLSIASLAVFLFRDELFSKDDAGESPAVAPPPRTIVAAASPPAEPMIPETAPPQLPDTHYLPRYYDICPHGEACTFFNCDGETFAQLSKQLTGSPRYAHRIMEYNRTHNLDSLDGWHYANDKCYGRIRLPNSFDEPGSSHKIRGHSRHH